jgi:hypothetical protein
MTPLRDPLTDQPTPRTGHPAGEQTPLTWPSGGVIRRSRGSRGNEFLAACPSVVECPIDETAGDVSTEKK